MPPLCLTLRTALHHVSRLSWVCTVWDFRTHQLRTGPLHCIHALHGISALHRMIALGLRIALAVWTLLHVCVSLLDVTVALGLWTLLRLGVDPGNVPLQCANRWRYHDAAPASHGLSVLHCIVAVGICTASGLAGHSLSKFHCGTVPRLSAFAWHNTSVPLLHCTALEMCLLLAQPITLHHCCCTAAPDVILAFPCVTTELASVPRFLLAAPVEQRLCCQRSQCSTPVAPSAHCPKSRYLHAV